MDKTGAAGGTESQSDAAKETIIEALAESDHATRVARAERILWLLSVRPKLDGIIAWSRLEPLRLLNEASDCYANGHYVAALLTATAFIGQTLDEKLESRGVAKNRRNSLNETIIAAREEKIFSDDILDRTDTLREKRVPFGHKKPHTHEHRLTNRFRKAGQHPDAVLQSDAQAAVELMYAYLSATVREDEQQPMESIEALSFVVNLSASSSPTERR